MSVIDERRRKQWQRRHRRVRLAVLLVGVGGAGALLFLLVTHLLSRYFGVEPVRRFLTAALGDIPFVGNAKELRPDSVGRMIERYDLLVRAGLGWIFAVLGGGLVKGNAIAGRLTRRFYRPYDPWALPPVEAPRGHDGIREAMRWREPSEARGLVWKAILASIQAGAAPAPGAKRRRWRRSPAETAFAWSLILGRPGAGKSRMAAEIARLLGRRALLRGETGETRAPRWRLLAGEWQRRRLPFLERRPDDPWDAGALDTAHFEQQLDSLKTWTPRRPSLLWLDDPPAQAASRCLDLLERRAAEGAFDHPVRLLISNQSLPIDLMRRPRVSCRGAFTLNSSALTPADVRALAPVLGARSSKLYKAEDLNFFMEVTQGNPLLVELAFDWLREGKLLRNLDEPSLLESRIERVRNALRAAGFPVEDMEAMRAMACLTLAGPACPIEPVNASFGNRIPPRSILEAAFPVEASRGVDLSRIGPSVRPDLVGDAFVRSVIAEQTPEQTARRISEAAFRARPDGWLRAVERAGGGGDPLAAALAREPEIDPADSATRILVAEALMRLALNGQGDVAESAGRVAALVRSSSQAADVVASLWQWFAEVVNDDWRERVARRTGADRPDLSDSLSGSYYRLVHGRPALLLGAALLQLRQQHRAEAGEVAALAPLDWFDAVLDLARRAERVGIFGWTEEDSDFLAERIALPANLAGQLEEADSDVILARRLALSDLVPVSLSNEICNCVAVAMSVFDAAAPPLAQAYFALQAGLGDAGAGHLAIREELESSAASLDPSVDAYSLVARMLYWEALADRRSKDKDLDGGREALARIDSMEPAADAPSRRRLVRCRLRVRGRLLKAVEADSDLCETIAREVEAIASDPEWEDDSECQIIRAEGWRRVAIAPGTDPDRRSDAIDRIRRIALKPEFRANRMMQVEYLDSLTSDESPLQEDEAALLEIESVARDPSYADDLEIQLIHASALAGLAVLTMDDPPRCKSFVKRLRQLGNSPGYDGDYQIQLAVLRGLDSLAFAWNSDAAVVREAATAAERIAKHPAFLDKLEFQRFRLKIWERMARVPDVEPALHLANVLKVESLGVTPLLAADPDAQLHRAMAWQNLAFTRRFEPSRCREACEKVEAITGALRHRRDEDMQCSRAEAWKYLGYGVEGAAECAPVTSKVEEIAARFPGNAMLQTARAQAWRDLAIKCEQDDPLHARCLAKLDAIVAASRPEWPLYKSIREFAAEARSRRMSRGSLLDGAGWPGPPFPAQ